MDPQHHTLDINFTVTFRFPDAFRFRNDNDVDLEKRITAQVEKTTADLAAAVKKATPPTTS